MFAGFRRLRLNDFMRVPSLKLNVPSHRGPASLEPSHSGEAGSHRRRLPPPAWAESCLSAQASRTVHPTPSGATNFPTGIAPEMRQELVGTDVGLHQAHSWGQDCAGAQSNMPAFAADMTNRQLIVELGLDRYLDDMSTQSAECHQAPAPGGNAISDPARNQTPDPALDRILDLSLDLAQGRAAPGTSSSVDVPCARRAIDDACVSGKRKSLGKRVPYPRLRRTFNPVDATLLRRLSALGALGILQAGGRDALARDYGVSAGMLRQFLRVDGTLTRFGEELVNPPQCRAQAPIRKPEGT